MQHNRFGEPRPKGVEELHMAINGTGIDVEQASVLIDPPGDDGFGGHGFTAEVIGFDEDDNEKTFSTLAYETKEALWADLKAVGFDSAVITS